MLTEDQQKPEPEEALDSSEELYQRFVFTADKGQEPYRIDKFLMNRIEGATHNKLQQVLVFKNNIEGHFFLLASGKLMKTYPSLLVYT